MYNMNMTNTRAIYTFQLVNDSEVNLDISPSWIKGRYLL